MSKRLFSLLGLLAFSQAAFGAEPLYVNTVAGNGTNGYADGFSRDSQLAYPLALCRMPDSTLVVADAANHVIRAIWPSGEVTTLAGRAGERGSNDGQAGLATFDYPAAVACQAGRVIVADAGGNTIRSIESGFVTTIAGRAGEPGYQDGASKAALFASPNGLAIDFDGSIYVADSANHAIRRIAIDGVVSTVAGLPRNVGHRDGIGVEARFAHPRGLAFDSRGDLYVADSANHVIRVVDRTGRVRTLAGSAGNAGYVNGSAAATRFDRPVSLAVLSDDTIIVADANNHVLRLIDRSGVTSLFAGSPKKSGYSDTTLEASQFDYPFAVVRGVADQLFIADMMNHRIRVIDTRAARRRGVRP